MDTNYTPREKNNGSSSRFWIITGVLFFGALFFFGAQYKENNQVATYERKQEKVKVPPKPVFDAVAYDKKMARMANNMVLSVSTSTGASTYVLATSTENYLWPVKAVYPNVGAILPFHRVIAYYGNLYSTKMGVLGEYPEDEMLARLDIEMAKWNKADPKTPAMPALHYIVATAQGSAGKEGKYILRMPDSQIDEVLRIAKKRDAIVFLDLQVALSNLQKELPYIEKYLKMPQVHLGIDPEFSMKSGAKPGTEVGTYDATDINYAANYLAKLVKENNLPPKILVVHRYTQAMVTNYKAIKPLPEVQIVMHMDGWGPAPKKRNTYERFIYGEPVQFTGFKIFYKNDIWDPGTKLMTPEDILKLKPQPVYIQYQ